MGMCLLAACQDTSVDVRTNKVSLFHVIEVWNAATFPAVIPKLSLVASYNQAAEDGETFKRQLLIAIDGEQLFDVSIDFDYQGQLVARAIGELHGFIVPRPGNLKISIVKDDGAEDGTLCIPVVNIGQPEFEVAR